MNKYGFGSRGLQKRSRHRNCENKSRYLLSAEEQPIQSIPAAAPLRELLNRICSALDRDIGNAKHFGLYPFCSAGVFSENDEFLGSLEAYSCVPGSPSIEELALFERATCLAAVAIELYNEASHHENRHIPAHRPVPGYVLEWPCSLN